MVKGCQVILNEAQGLRQGRHSNVQMFSEPVQRHVMLAVNVSASHRQFVSVIGYILYWHFHTTCHIIFTLNVCDLAFCQGMVVELQVTRLRKRLLEIEFVFVFQHLKV